MVSSQQTSAAITGICPVIYTWKRLLRAEVKAAGKTFKSSQKKRWGTHIFQRSLHSHSPCIICMPMRAHTHTHTGITHPISISPAQLSTASHSHSLPLSPPPLQRQRQQRQCYSARVYLLFSPHNTNNPPGNRNGVCLIIIFI